MTDIAKIAAELNFAERKALNGEFVFATQVEQETGEARLYSLGLWKMGFLKRGEGIRTPLGLAVRDYLREKNDV